MFYRVCRLFCALLLLASWSTATQAQQPETINLPTGFEDTLLASVVSPTALAFTPDGRMLITTQPGQLRIYAQGALLPTPALDLSATICSDRERGMLGVVADPNFASNHYIYIYHTFKKFAGCNLDKPDSPINRLVRFTLPDSNVIDPASALILLDNIPSPEGVHNSGDLHFGKDGYLYVSVGDGGCYYADPQRCYISNPAARELNVLSGKILRITADGAIPADNPLLGPDSVRCQMTGPVAPGKVCEEIFAYGLRNPFRMAFDENAPTTRFYINDVGHKEWEEINEGKAGADYGWSVREGHCVANSLTDCGAPSPSMTNPIYDYNHDTGCKAITDGVFVPNKLWPAVYDDAYLFSDYKCGTIFQLVQKDGGYSTTPFATGLGTKSATAMTFGPADGGAALYYSVYITGEIHRIVYTGARSRAPVAALAAQPAYGGVPLDVTFDAGGSRAGTDTALAYAWDFGDGSTPVETKDAKITHTYTRQGTYSATLKLHDAQKSVASAPAQVRVDVGNSPPTAQIVIPRDARQYRVGQKMTLTASASDEQDGKLPAEALEWHILLHHNDHTHPFLQPTKGSSVTIEAPPPEDFSATTTSYLEIYLTATDSKGLTHTTRKELRPKLVKVTFNADPPARQIIVNSTPLTTSQTVVAWAGYALNVSVPPQQDGAGNALAVRRWSDGDTNAERTLITPDTSTTYTVTLEPQRSAKMPLIVGGVIAALALGGAAGIWRWRRKHL